MTASKRIVWNGRHSADNRFMVQTERVRGEAPLHFLEMSQADEDVRRRLDLETAFFGRGGIAKAKAAAQQIADASC